MHGNKLSPIGLFDKVKAPARLVSKHIPWHVYLHSSVVTQLYQLSCHAILAWRS